MVVPKRKRNVKIDTAEKCKVVGIEDLDFNYLEEFTLPPIDSGMEAEEEKELHLKKIIDSGKGNIPIPIIKEVENPSKMLYTPFQLPSKYINWKEKISNEYCMDSNDFALCNEFNLSKEEYLKVVDEIESDAFVKIENEDKIMEYGTNTPNHPPLIPPLVPNTPIVNSSLTFTQNNSKVDTATLQTSTTDIKSQPPSTNLSDTFIAPALQDCSTITLSQDVKQKIKDLARYKRLIRDEDKAHPSYVCFRRRVLKPSRKNRRSEAQTYEKVIRLNSELELLNKLTSLRMKVENDNEKIFNLSFEISKLIYKIKNKHGEKGYKKVQRVFKKFKEEQNQVGVCQQEDIFKNILLDRDRIRLINKRLKFTKDNINEEDIEKMAIGYSNYLKNIYKGF